MQPMPGEETFKLCLPDPKVRYLIDALDFLFSFSVVAFEVMLQTDVDKADTPNVVPAFKKLLRFCCFIPNFF